MTIFEWGILAHLLCYQLAEITMGTIVSWLCPDEDFVLGNTTILEKGITSITEFTVALPSKTFMYEIRPCLPDLQIGICPEMAKPKTVGFSSKSTEFSSHISAQLQPFDTTLWVTMESGFETPRIIVKYNGYFPVAPGAQLVVLRKHHRA